MIPYSAGVSRRAKTSPTKKVIPELAILSTKLHPTPRIVLFFKDSDTNKHLLFSYRHKYPVAVFLFIRQHTPMNRGCQLHYETQQ